MADEGYSIEKRWCTKPYDELPDKGYASQPGMLDYGDDKWRVIIFPKGYGDESAHVSAVILAVGTEVEDKNVQLTLSTIGGTETATKTVEFLASTLTKNCVISKFIPLASLQDYLRPDGRLGMQITLAAEPRGSALPNTRKKTGYVGIVNQGATCYLNAVLQCLFHTPAFRRIIFRMATDGTENEHTSIPLNLQRLFCLLHLAPTAPDTKALTTSFGWGRRDVLEQHDVHEFLRQFFDNLETKMKGTDAENAIATLFRGSFVSRVTALEGDYVSPSRIELFYDLIFYVQGVWSLKEAFERVVQDQYLLDSNRYQLDDGRMVDAFKATRFMALPPVLHIRLERHGVYAGVGVALTSLKFTFPFEIDLAQFLAEDAKADEPMTYQLFCVIVHMGDDAFGHYFTYCRPTAAREWFRFDDSRVSRVSEHEAIDANFGGSHMGQSASFLMYIRRSRIDEIMRPVMKAEMAPHVREYYRDWKRRQLGGKAYVALRVLRESDYESFFEGVGIARRPIDTERFLKVPPEAKFGSFKRALGKEESMWMVGERGYPTLRIDERLTVQERFPRPNPQVFVSQFASEKVDGEVPLFFGFYDPAAQHPLQYGFFAVVPPSMPLHDVSFYVRGKFGIPLFSELEAYLFIEEIVCRKLLIEEPIGAQDVKNGLVAFQLVNPNMEKKFAESDVYRLIDHVPELACPTVLAYWNATKKATTLKVATFGNPESIQFTLICRSKTKIRDLLVGLRNILHVDEGSGLLLFAIDSATKQPSPIPIQNEQEASVELQLIGRVVFYEVIPDTTQDELASKLLFKIPVFDAALRLLSEPVLVMSRPFGRDAVIRKLKSAGIVEQDVPIRILEINAARIVKEVDESVALDKFMNMTYRAEVVPEDQIEGRKVRVQLTHSSTAPMTERFGLPFFLTVRDREPFAETKERLLEISQVPKERAKFAYTNNSSGLQNFTMLKGDDVLADLLAWNNTMVYIILPAAYRPGSPSARGGLKIYN
jgi:ubiquitin C-terminal hydrolase